MKNREYIFSLVIGAVFILSLITNWYGPLVVILSIILTIMVLDKLGKGIVLRELMALHSCFVCLLMPLVGFYFYNETNALSRLWQKYMDLPFDFFFGFSLPAVSGFCFFLCWPLSGNRGSDSGKALRNIIERSKNKLKLMPMTGIHLMLFGIIVYFFSGFLPVVLQFAFLLFYFASFSGFLYVYFMPSFKKKVLILSLFAIFIFGEALQSGMFTIVAYMGITLFSFFFVGRRVAFWKKLSFFLLGLIFLFMLQSVKQTYRLNTWRGDFQGNKFSLFTTLIQDKFSSTSSANFENEFFPFYARVNQGFNVGLIMKRIPKQQDFDGGKNLFTNLLSSFVPRIFWPDKPEAGGKYNMAFYTGYIIEGWSTNVGPVGEAYGSFGVNGGIIFMVVLGAFIRWSYRIIFRVSVRVPLIIFWIPVIFYQVTYSAESDTLQILNSLIKSAFFVWILYRFRPGLFGIVKTPFARNKKVYINKTPAIATTKA